MKNTTMRVLSVLLSLLLVMTLAPLSVLAEGTGVAKIGDTEYESLSAAITAAVDGDTIVITTEGPHKLNGFNKEVTIASAQGVEAKIDMSSPVAMNNGTKTITFEGITFVYGNANYVGLQHAGKLVYNGCTINGQVFLYGTSEIFNNCTFNQDSAGAYNVWTYGAKYVEFNDCTFNCVGKSVLVYNEGAGGTDLSVENTTFNASAPVEGKAAIEIDGTLLPAGQIFNIGVDETSTATGFDAGNVSGNTLWNNKKGDDAAMVEVADEIVLVPASAKTATYVAYIGGQGYETVPAALAAAVAGQTVQVMAGTYNDASWSVKAGVSLVGAGDVALNGKISASGSNIYVANIKVSNPYGTALYIGGNGMFENCSFIGSNGTRWCYANGGNVTFKDCVVKGDVYGIHFDGGDGKVIIDGCTITGWTSFGGTLSEIKMKDTSFEKGNYNYIRFYQDAVIEGCTFNKDMGIDIAGDVTENSVTITESVVEGGAPIESLFSENDLASSVTAGVAKVNGINYKTFADALAAAKAGDTIILIADIEDAGFAIDKSITIDFNGYTYTVTAPVAGTDGIVIKSGVNVTLKNGTITNGASDIYALIQNFANLTVEDMTIRGGNAKFALSNNICKVQILGDTS
ncbi:MAG: right-handed parallel beta-helix repeat-containing protein, partial [Clostridia bacterium]|nr:right-handed parallel beta-helix repeat-containing protein [Clostridia bacterium]